MLAPKRPPPVLHLKEFKGRTRSAAGDVAAPRNNRVRIPRPRTESRALLGSACGIFAVIPVYAAAAPAF